MNDEQRSAPSDAEPILPVENCVTMPSFSLDELDGQYTDIEQRLTNEEEDALLKVNFLIRLRCCELTCH